MEIIVLSDKEYEDKDKRYGDSIIVNYGNGLLVYDCGSEEHADRILSYMNKNGIDKLNIVLSHNDSDHFNGIPLLIESKKVNMVITLLLLKYVDEIWEKIDDKRKTRESIKKQIEDLYDNIYTLSGNNLKDALDTDLFIDDNIKVVGPSKEYFLEAVAKQLDGRESNEIDKETVMNAISIQLEVNFGNNKVLLTGDANFESLKDKVRNYDGIQLPHHGKEEQATSIFSENGGRNGVLYFISDNTGNTNGGSDELDTTGHRVRNTKDGDIYINENDLTLDNKKRGTLGAF